ncbi:GNAT family N-acetyltransferase [Phenylobacterium sp.]|uniref:GNAT family N-acetyltransferase n=1 Tax=Phenylobacterium sp. TaxID=1871053 RepID=UPI0026220083|nr:N-acetyltransferase [Phenylobacterium sp.]
MIRHARAADHAAIRAVNLAAFPEAAEADLVERLRADGDVVFEMVAEAQGEIVGHILFSRLWADSANLYVALAPMAVRPEHQRRGLGSALVRGGLEFCKECGAHGVVVLGHPDYYPRFGFSAEAAAQIRSPYAGSPGFMAKAFEDDAFEAPLTLAYPDAFGGL